MSREVRSDDFSDSELGEFFDSVERLTWSTVASVPSWVEEEADAFAATPPRPELPDLRRHIEHAVAVARGWDDPDDARIMLHAAIKSFYLIAWLEHLQHHRGTRSDLAMGYRVSFTPNFRTPGTPGIPGSPGNP